jgi:hypothetical protein
VANRLRAEIVTLCAAVSRSDRRQVAVEGDAIVGMERNEADCFALARHPQLSPPDPESPLFTREAQLYRE